MDKHKLINTHIPFAQTLAKKKKRQVNKSVYYEDLESAAYRGLVDAANLYDNRVPFKNYAAIRIMGEMDDYLREIQWGSKANRIAMGVLDTDIEDEDEPETIDLMQFIPDEARPLFLWYYREGLTMKQIGDRLGLTESSVSKMMKKYKDDLVSRREEILTKIGVY